MTEFEVGQEIAIERYNYGSTLYKVSVVTKCNKRFVHTGNQVFSLTTRKERGTSKEWVSWKLSGKTPDEVKLIIKKESLIANIKEFVRIGGLNKLSVGELEQVKELIK